MTSDVAPLSRRTHLTAVAALGGVIALTWATVALVPGLSDRIGAVPTARAGESRAALLTAAVLIAGALLFARALGEPIRFGRARPALILAALPIGIAGLAIALALSWAAGAVRQAVDPAPVAHALLLGWLLVLWAAASEELLFRGFLLPALRRAWGARIALAASGAAFTFIHFLGGWRDPVSLANIFAAALWFGLLALRSGGVAAPLLAHAGWNGAEALIFGASPNPGVGAYGSLFDVDLVGPALLGGSADGLNASLTASIVLALLIAWTARRRRPGEPAPEGRGARDE